MPVHLFRAISLVFLVFAAVSAFSAEEVLVDTSQALGALQYDNPLVRGVSCFEADGDCVFVMTGTLQEGATKKNYLSLWQPTGETSAKKLAALPVGDQFFRFVSKTSGDWLSLFVETINAPPSVYLFNRVDKTFINASGVVARHGAIEQLKSAKVDDSGVLSVLFDAPAGCCEINKIDIKSGELVGKKKLVFEPGQEVSPVDFAVVQDGYAVAGGLADSPEDVGAVSISNGNGSEFTLLQHKDRYYYSVVAEAGHVYATGKSMKTGGEVLAAYTAKEDENVELIVERFSTSSGSQTLSFGRLCGDVVSESYTNQGSEPYMEFEFTAASMLGGGGAVDSSDYKIGTSSPLAFMSVIPFVQRNKLFIVINAKEFDEVTRGFNDRVYNKEIGNFFLCAND